MFTIKLYTGSGYRNVIMAADSFTILRGPRGEAEITLHRKSGDDIRVDIVHDEPTAAGQNPPTCPQFQKAIIENAAGKTTEIITLIP